jgi:hypothetical protein
VEQARRHRIDGALLLVPRGSRPAATGTYFTARALEAAGIPTLQLWADMVDARQWDGAAAPARHTIHRTATDDRIASITPMTPLTPITIFLVGDLILDEPEPDSFFDLSRATLQSADLVIGHVEVPHTTRGIEQSSDVPAPPANPEHLAALARASFHVVTLAGNHMFDQGAAGVEDTIAALRRQNIAPTGAGLNLDEARRPAIVERAGLRTPVKLPPMTEVMQWPSHHSEEPGSQWLRGLLQETAARL